MKRTVRLLFSDPCSDMGIARTALSICRHLNGPELEAYMHVPTAAYAVRAPFLRPALPYIRFPVPWEPHFRLIASYARGRLYRRFHEALADGDAAYLWSNAPLPQIHDLRERGAPIIREKFNCHAATAQRILHDAYERLGVAPDARRISNAAVSYDRESLALADFVSSPSPCVTASLHAEGTPPERIIETSYGWDPRHIDVPRPRRRAEPELTILFVGAVCVRKGAHNLLDAWARAKIGGRLVLCGAIEPLIADRYADILNRADVLSPGRVKDVRSHYRSADVFVLPSLEEGSPLVTYEALASGLPVIVSPMGAGGVVRDGREGLIRDPDNIDAWIEALHRLAADGALRRALGGAARERAEAHTWEKVGARRRREILHCLDLHDASIASRRPPFAALATGSDRSRAAPALDRAA